MKFILSFFIFLPILATSQSVEKGKTLYQEKRLDEAAKTFAVVNKSQKDYAESRYYLGRIAFDKNELDKAQTYFEEAIDVNATVADYHYWLGNTLGAIAQGANTFKQGILAPKIKSAFERTVELDPTNIPAHRGLIEFYTQAPGFMGGSWQKAEETARNIQKINEAEGHHAMATVYQRQNKLKEAEDEMRKAYQADENYIIALGNFYIQQKQFDKAFQVYESALQKNQDDVRAIYQVGKISAVSGQRLDYGEQCLKRYLIYQPKPAEPSHAAAYMRLGQIKERGGNKTEARTNYEKALALDNSLKEAKEGLARVK